MYLLICLQDCMAVQPIIAFRGAQKDMKESETRHFSQSHFGMKLIDANSVHKVDFSTSRRNDSRILLYI